MSITATPSAASSVPRYPHEQWSSRLAFILAAAGSAIGLGNIWKFPYIAGVYGGGAFVLVYLVCVAVIGVPIMMAEIMIGRRIGQSPINSLRLFALQEGRSSAWQAVGWLGVLSSFVILSFYSVIAGWGLAYLVYAAAGGFYAGTAQSIGTLFADLLDSPGRLLFWHSVFMLMTILVVAGGVKAGLERSVTYMLPALCAVLLLLVGYAAVETGQFGAGLAFLFAPDFSKLTTVGVLTALGHAFFTLSLGAGAMIAYGSYLPRHISIARAAITVSFLDTVTALLAGMAIFPIVFAAGLPPGSGPGLVFQTLPLAFGAMPLGGLVGFLFFVLLVLAALASSISLLEPAVEWLEEHRGVRRVMSAFAVGIGAWLLGIATLLSFNRWSDIKLFGKSIFDALDFLTTNITLPLGGLLTAVFAAWVVSRRASREELEMGDGLGYRLWHFALRYVTPVGVLIVFLYNLF